MAILQQALLVACMGCVAASKKPLSEVDKFWMGMAVGPQAEARRLATISFSGLSVPAGADQDKALMSKEVKVLDETVLTAANDEENYQIVVQAGEAWRANNPYVGDTFGVIMEKGTSSKPVFSYDFTTGVADTNDKFVSNNPDFSSMIHKDGETYMIVHLEDRPGATYFLELEQNADTGALTLKKSTHMDWGADGGMWVPCAGSLSPWNTHLGAEEYEPDAKAWASAKIDAFETGSRRRATPKRDAQDWMRYHGSYPTTADFATWKAAFDSNFKPYQLGYPFEAGPSSASAGYFATKRMAMGRRSGELPYVMPDKKTVYLTDDGGNVYLSMFVADIAEDLSAGELFCAKVTQTSAEKGGTFTVEWKSMGGATEAEIRTASTTTAFADLFEEATPTSTNFPAACPEGFKTVHGSAGLECLKLKTGMEKLASRFESRRYASYLGCTTEWNKMEGFTYSVDSKKGYTVMSTITGAMEDRASKGQATDANDAGTGNHVRVPYNECGCVYELAMGDDHKATTIQGLVCGVVGDGTDAENECNTTFISNPDNVASVQGHNALLIGEDTGNHKNNIMWKYNLDTGSLEERIAATPEGAEVCSPYFYPDVGGFSYLTMVVQHPGSGYIANGGEAGVGYAVWQRQCGASYPDWAMPGDGSADRCTSAEASTGFQSSTGFQASTRSEVVASNGFQARPVVAALVVVLFSGLLL